MGKIKSFMCGINTPHNLNYISPSRLFSDAWVFMCFSTPFIINSPNGTLRGEAGDFIINRPRNQFRHTNTEGAKMGFVNCWCHIESDDISELLSKYELLSDTIYHTVDSSVFMYDLMDIENELAVRSYYSDDMLFLLVQKFIINLSRQDKMHDVKYIVTDRWAEAVSKLRHDMLINYAKQYTIDSLSKELNVSSEYFSVLYKKIFKISPMKDLCLKRISTAKALLISTDMPVNSIAALCGYADSNYFSRLFKKITGVSPLQYRK